MTSDESSGMGLIVSLLSYLMMEAEPAFEIKCEVHL